MLEAAPGLKYKAALSVAYGVGLRVSEVVSLKVSDIDSKRMLIRIPHLSRGFVPCSFSDAGPPAGGTTYFDRSRLLANGG